MGNTNIGPVLITGGTSGIGLACAELFARKGVIVYAASRHAKGKIRHIGKGEIRPLALDVCEETSVSTAVGHILNEEGRIGTVIHCAGIGIAGAAEDTPIEAATAQMQTNFFGVLRVNRLVLPHMRQYSSGLVLIIGSVAGLFPIPFQSHYSASKFALDAYASALQMELKPFGIRVSMLLPGDTKTSFTAARQNACPLQSPYWEICYRSVAKMEKDEQKGRLPESCARIAFRLSQCDHPPLRTVVGIEYKLLAFAKRFLPDRFILFILSKMYMPK